MNKKDSHKLINKEVSFLSEIKWSRKGLPWYFKLYFWRVKPKIDIVVSEIKSWPFRIKNGFDYRDTWNLDYNVAKYVLPRLKHLRNNNEGYPVGLTHKKWLRIEDKMIFAFEKLMDKDYFYDKKTDKKLQEGLDLFGKYFRNLWD